MNILDVIPFFSPKFGGSVRSTYLLCKHLAEKGHNVTILTTDFQYDQSFAIELKNVEIIPLKCFFNIASFLYSPTIHLWLSEKITGYDIIHLHSYRSYQNVVVSEYAKKFNIPYVISSHGSVVPFFEKITLKKIYDLTWGYKILKGASYSIALTESEAKQYESMGVVTNKIKIIPNATDISIFSNIPPKGSFRSKYGILNDKKIILFLGRLHKIKGLKNLFHAFSILLNHLDNIELVIIGPDEGMLSELKSLVKTLNIEKNVIFSGPLYNLDKYEALVDADILVLPSLYDTFGNVVLEAWAFSKPVIVTDTCGISHFSENCGIVIKYDINQLCNAMYSLLTNDGCRELLGKNGYENLCNNFSMDILTKRIEDVYESAILK